jgi:hypothetical protein
MKYLLIPVIMSALVISCVSKSDSRLLQAQNDSLNRRKQDITHVIHWLASERTATYETNYSLPGIYHSAYLAGWSTYSIEEYEGKQMICVHWDNIAQYVIKQLEAEGVEYHTSHIAGNWTIEYSNKIFVPEIPDSIAEELPYDEAERRRTAGSQVSN